MKLITVFGTNLKYYRAKANLSQEELAEKAGLHRNYISDIECFRRNISIANIEKLAIALNVSPTALLENNKK